MTAVPERDGPEPSDPEYRAMIADLTKARSHAGLMLTASYLPETEHPDVARRLAEEAAQKAAALMVRMKEWRLVHGWSS